MDGARVEEPWMGYEANGEGETVAQSMHLPVSATRPSGHGTTVAEAEPTGPAGLSTWIPALHSLFSRQPSGSELDRALRGIEFDQALDVRIASVLWRSDSPLAAERDRQRGPSRSLHRVCSIAHLRGFQLWSLASLRNPELIASDWGGPVKLVHPLAEPRWEARRRRGPGLAPPLESQRPLVAVVPASPTRDARLSCVRVYSLRTHRPVHTLRLREEVYDVMSSPRAVLVATRSAVYAFDPATLENRFSVPTAPSAPGAVPAALGPRFLLLAMPATLAPRPEGEGQGPDGGTDAGAAPPAGGIEDGAGGGPRGQSVVRWPAAPFAGYSWRVWDAARVIVSGIGAVREAGARACAALGAGQGSGEGRDSSSGRGPHEGGPLNVGVVGIFDLAESSPSCVGLGPAVDEGDAVARLALSPDGQLVAAAPPHGQEITVSLLQAAAEEGRPPAVRLVPLYRCARGLTRAVIRSMAFSEDSHWLAATSARGTTHVFAVHPSGARPSVWTHVPEGASAADHPPTDPASVAEGAPVAADRRHVETTYSSAAAAAAAWVATSVKDVGPALVRGRARGVSTKAPAPAASTSQPHTRTSTPRATPQSSPSLRPSSPAVDTGDAAPAASNGDGHRAPPGDAHSRGHSRRPSEHSSPDSSSCATSRDGTPMLCGAEGPGHTLRPAGGLVGSALVYEAGASAPHPVRTRSLARADRPRDAAVLACWAAPTAQRAWDEVLSARGVWQRMRVLSAQEANDPRQRGSPTSPHARHSGPGDDPSLGAAPSHGPSEAASAERRQWEEVYRGAAASAFHRGRLVCVAAGGVMEAYSLRASSEEAAAHKDVPGVCVTLTRRRVGVFGRPLDGPAVKVPVTPSTPSPARARDGDSEEGEEGGSVTGSGDASLAQWRGAQAELDAVSHRRNGLALWEVPRFSFAEYRGGGEDTSGTLALDQLPTREVTASCTEGSALKLAINRALGGAAGGGGGGLDGALSLGAAATESPEWGGTLTAAPGCGEDCFFSLGATAGGAASEEMPQARTLDGWSAALRRGVGGGAHATGAEGEGGKPSVSAGLAPEPDSDADARNGDGPLLALAAHTAENDAEGDAEPDSE